MPGNRFDRNPRMLVTTFWGDPVAAPKSDPPNLVNSADGDDSPVVLELSSCDATVLFLLSYVIKSCWELSSDFFLRWENFNFLFTFGFFFLLQKNFNRKYFFSFFSIDFFLI